MERITYRITLDAHRNGIQRTLQGFETADIMARRISVNLTAGGDTFELPMSNVTAMMYVTTPSAKSPSINECVIDGNTIIYDCEPIVEEGTTEMQLKVVETSPNGAMKVLIAPRFAVEVTESNANDAGAMQSTTFTALEHAIAKAEATHESRLLRVVIEDDCVFKAYYADGTVYENDYFRDAMYNGNALLSQSYAIGGAGIRAGEDTDNSKYYSNVSRSASEDAKKVYEESQDLMRETQKQANYTYFDLNFETGNLGYISTYADFNINKETGQLEISKDQTYTPEDVILSNATGAVGEIIASYGTQVETNTASISAIEENLNTTNTNVSTLEGNLNATNTNVSTLEENLNTTNTNISAIEESLYVTNVNISTLQEYSESTKEEVDALSERDYIVEQGTDGIWTYRKWASGIAECWGKASFKNLDCGANNYGGFYYSKGQSVAFPVNLFIENPIVTFDGGSLDYVNFVRDFGSYKTHAYFLVASHVQRSADVNVIMNAKGIWK